MLFFKYLVRMAIQKLAQKRNHYGGFEGLVSIWKNIL